MTMTVERWQRLQDVFHLAVDRPPADRRAFLEELGCDEELAREALELIDAHGSISDVHTTKDEPSPVTGRRIGPYVLTRELGHGGMATVYLAIRDDAEFKKEVAIKLVKRGVDSEFVVNRFRTERQILASLNHPNISHLLDGGTTDDGVVYLVMEVVDGQPIDAHCASSDVDLDGRLELFLTVCDAVQYANEGGVIHRDLKPGNILVTPTGQVKLLDFGIAKITTPTFEDTVARTATGTLMMTPQYASPEQIRGEQVSPATDIYSLGVLLYELLTETLPYPIQNSSPHEVARIITESDPIPPSAQPLDLTVRRRLRGDLDSIILTALRKEPSRRYGAVADLAEDVRRHLRGVPVKARPDTLPYRAGKFLRRNRKLAIAATLVFAIAISVALTTTVTRPPARSVVYTPKPAAHEAYLRGSLLLSQRTPDALRKAIASFQEATRVDPNYVAAWIGYGEAVEVACFYGAVPPREYRRARDAALHALALDPAAAEPHVTLAVALENNWEWSAAEREFRRAIELDPKYAPAHHKYALLLGTQRRMDEATAEIRKAEDLNPTSPVLNTLEGVIRIYSGRYDDAIELGSSYSQQNPNWYGTYYYLSDAFTMKGRFGEAVAAAQKAQQLAPGEHLSAAYLATALARSGRTPEAEVMIEDFRRKEKNENFQPSLIAIALTSLGKTDEAFACLDRAATVHDPMMAMFLTSEPTLEPLRKDPRYRPLLRRIGLAAHVRGPHVR